MSHPAQFRRASPGSHLRVISAPLLALHRPARAHSHAHDHASLEHKHPVRFRTGERSLTRAAGAQQRHHDHHPGPAARNEPASVSVWPVWVSGLGSAPSVMGSSPLLLKTLF